jgi:hypothetical protein
VESIRQLNEPQPFFRGLLVETGYAIETVMFQRPPRRRAFQQQLFHAA